MTSSFVRPATQSQPHHTHNASSTPGSISTVGSNRCIGAPSIGTHHYASERLQNPTASSTSPAHRDAICADGSVGGMRIHGRNLTAPKGPHTPATPSGARSDENGVQLVATPTKEPNAPRKLLRCVVSLGEEGYVNLGDTILGEGAQSRVFRYRSSEGYPVAVKVIAKSLSSSRTEMRTESRESHNNSEPEEVLSLSSSLVTASFSLLPSLVKSDKTERPDDRSSAACRRPMMEVLCLTRLRDHPSVVQCLDAVQTDKEVCIITEEFGIDLDHWLRHVKENGLGGVDTLRSTSIPVSGDAYLECVRNATRQLVRVLHDLHHDAKIAHRDIKLHNVLMHQGTIKLIDFGSATLCVRPEESLFSVSVKGTLGYMAPELLDCAVKGSSFRTDRNGLYKTDTFALGVLVYHLVFGRAPFRVSDLIDVLPPVHVVRDKEERFRLSAVEMLNRMKRFPTLFPRGIGCSMVTPNLKSFLRGLLELCPEERWDITKASNALWLSDDNKALTHTEVCPSA